MREKRKRRKSVMLSTELNSGLMLLKRYAHRCASVFSLKLIKQSPGEGPWICHLGSQIRFHFKDPSDKPPGTIWTPSGPYQTAPGGPSGPTGVPRAHQRNPLGVHGQPRGAPPGPKRAPANFKHGPRSLQSKAGGTRSTQGNCSQAQNAINGLSEATYIHINK